MKDKKSNNKKKVNFKNNEKEKSRYIPRKVERVVNERDGFECAWCGIKHTERHHIYEYSEDGENTVDNLILLCPTCHTEVHKKDGSIKHDDLIQRQSTHLRGDRISGSLQFQLKEPKVKFGQTTIESLANILKFDSETVIKLDKVNDDYFLSCRFYNKNGDLIFWMSRNRYWSPSDFLMFVSGKHIEIKTNSTSKNHLKMWEENGELNLEVETYRNGNIFSVSSEQILLGTPQRGIVIKGAGKIIGADGSTLFNI